MSPGRRIRPFLAISGITYAEVTRQPAFGIVVFGTLVLQALSPALAMFGFGQDLALMKEFSLSTVFLSCVILVALGAWTVMGGELESKATSTILSKPVGRGVFLAARFAGLVCSLLVAVYLCLLVLLLAARQGPPETIAQPLDWPVIAGGLGGGALGWLVALGQSYRSSRPPGSVAMKTCSITLTAGVLVASVLDPGGHWQAPGRGFDPLLVEAVALIALAAVVLCSAALLLEVVFPRGAFLGTILVFLIGLLWGGRDNVWLSLVPSLQAFWVGEVFYTTDAAVPLEYLLVAAAYAFSCSLVCLLIGAWLLERREVG